MLSLNNTETSGVEPKGIKAPDMNIEIPEGLIVSEAARHILEEAEGLREGSALYDQKMLEFWFVVEKANPENQLAMANVLRLKAKLNLGSMTD